MAKAFQELGLRSDEPLPLHHAARLERPLSILRGNQRPAHVSESDLVWEALGELRSLQRNRGQSSLAQDLIQRFLDDVWLRGDEKTARMVLGLPSRAAGRAPQQSVAQSRAAAVYLELVQLSGCKEDAEIAAYNAYFAGGSDDAADAVQSAQPPEQTQFEIDSSKETSHKGKLVTVANKTMRTVIRPALRRSIPEYSAPPRGRPRKSKSA